MMDAYQQCIKDYLDTRAAGDPVFKEKYETGLAGKKDIRACCNYIIAEVEKTGRRGFADEEIYGMAVHFYDEAAIDAPKSALNCQVVINREVQLSEEEIARIRERARKDAEAKIRQDEMSRVARGKKTEAKASDRKMRAEIRREERAKIRRAEKERAAEKQARKNQEARRRIAESGPTLFDI